MMYTIIGENEEQVASRDICMLNGNDKSTKSSPVVLKVEEICFQNGLYHFTEALLFSPIFTPRHKFRLTISEAHQAL